MAKNNLTPTENIQSEEIPTSAVLYLIKGITRLIKETNGSPTEDEWMSLFTSAMALEKNMTKSFTEMQVVEAIRLARDFQPPALTELEIIQKIKGHEQADER